MIELTVIIPTYNRSDVLVKTLEALSVQSVKPNRFEVIIVDDGSNKNELTHLQQVVKGYQFETRLFLLTHKGPATARNLGIRQAKGKIALIINDDTVPGPELIARHLLFHKEKPKENYGLLGRVTWHQEITITPFMYWLENGGPYFSFHSIKGKVAGWQRLWTCNISFKKKFLLINGLFDESFPDAAWEDIELGYRLHRAGLRLFYDKKAIGYHYHPTTIASIKNKMEANGRNLILIRQKLPEEFWPPLAKSPRLFFTLDRLFLLPFFARVAQMFPNFFDQLAFAGPFFDFVLFHYRVDGLRKNYR